MDSIPQWRTLIERLLTEHSELPYSEKDVESQLIFDRDRDRYLLVVIGWHGSERLHGIHIHLDIHEERIWIQYDGTEHGIAHDLVAAGVPKDHIVLGFKPPHLRQYTGYAALLSGLYPEVPDNLHPAPWGLSEVNDAPALVGHRHAEGRRMRGAARSQGDAGPKGRLVCSFFLGNLPHLHRAALCRRGRQVHLRAPGPQGALPRECAGKKLLGVLCRGRVQTLQGPLHSPAQ